MDNNSAIEEYVRIRPLYQRLSNKVALIVEELLELKKINFHAITFRAKTVDSFAEKIKKPKYKDPLNELTDLAGIRIIGYVEDDVKQICQIIEELFDYDPHNSLDKSLELGVDKVGYKSVHYICSLSKERISLPEYERFKNMKFEIQIRTILQHSWAEIEHDKNYKFSGELPPDIQRRFKLVAGSLELADREFNQLSTDIDNYAKSVKKSTERGELKIKINSTALKHYLTTKFKDLIKLGILQPDFNGSENESVILEELRSFGVDTLEDLDKIIDKNLAKTIKDKLDNNNLLGLSRLIMLSADFKKYFENSFNGQWSGLADGHELVLLELGVNAKEIEKYLYEI